MPFTFNGVGTTLYGSRDFEKDGSYITTEWIVVAYVPILPFRSLRILPTGNNKSYGLYRSSSYLILKKMTPNLVQVGCVYGWFASVILPIWAASALNLWWLGIPGVLMIGAPWFLRRRAIKRFRENAVSEATA